MKFKDCRLVYGEIYKIVNSVNGKIYIGQTTQKPARKRLKGHVSGRYKSMPVVNAIQKYGRENFTFEVIAQADSRERLNKKEAKFIKKFKSNDKNFGYNIGKIVNNKVKLADSTRKKLSEHSQIYTRRPERRLLSRKIGLATRGKKRDEVSTSRFVGVHLDNYGHWKASICFNKKSYDLGAFKIEKNAAKAYDIAALNYFGNNCILNFPEYKDLYLINKITPIKYKKKKLLNLPLGLTYDKGYRVIKTGYPWKRFKLKKEALVYLEMLNSND